MILGVPLEGMELCGLVWDVEFNVVGIFVLEALISNALIRYAVLFVLL